MHALIHLQAQLLHLLLPGCPLLRMAAFQCRPLSLPRSSGRRQIFCSSSRPGGRSGMRCLQAGGLFLGRSLCSLQVRRKLPRPCLCPGQGLLQVCRCLLMGVQGLVQLLLRHRCSLLPGGAAVRCSPLCRLQGRHPLAQHVSLCSGSTQLGLQPASLGLVLRPNRCQGLLQLQRLCLVLLLALKLANAVGSLRQRLLQPCLGGGQRRSGGGCVSARAIRLAGASLLGCAGQRCQAAPQLALREREGARGKGWGEGRLAGSGGTGGGGSARPRRCLGGGAER